MKLLKNFLLEAQQFQAFESKLGNHVEIKTNFPDADFWIVRRHDRHVVGSVETTYNPEHFGIKVKESSKGLIDPTYLKYMMTYIHSRGYYTSLPSGSTKLVNIKKKHIEDIPLSFQG